MRKLLITLGLNLCLVFGVSALHTSDVTVSLGSGPYVYADDGNCGGTREIPLASYIVLRVVNNSSTDTLYNIKVKLDSIGTTGFKLLSFRDDSTTTIPRILPSDSSGAFFYMQHPCTQGISCEFKFTLSDTGTQVVTYYPTVTTYDIQPASAGGQVDYQNISGIDALGILLADTVRYNFGNFKGGDIFFQPSGDTLFPVDDLELIGSEVLSSEVMNCAVGPGDRNKLYFNDIAKNGCGANTGGSSNLVTVVYYYLSSLYIDTAVFKPYAGMLSGGPIKYTGNYATGIARDEFVTTAAANQFGFTKKSSCTQCSSGDTITYTITVSNPTSEILMFDRILDSLPINYTYLGFAPGSDITKGNSSVYPDSGATGSIEFTGLIPETTFPYRSYVIPAGDSVELKYLVKLPISSDTNFYENRAIGQIGSVNFDTAFAQTCIGCNALPVAMIYFNGNLIGETVQLHWATASEIDNAGFDLYRKGDESDEFLGFIPGNGTKFTITEYDFTDYFVPTETTLYKLVQKDYDGKHHTYYTRVNGSVDLATKKSYQVYPNPSTSEVNVFVNAEADQVDIRLISVLGEDVLTRTIQNEGMRAHAKLNTTELPTGVYYVEVLLDGRVQQRTKILKK